MKTTTALLGALAVAPTAFGWQLLVGNRKTFEGYTDSYCQTVRHNRDGYYTWRRDVQPNPPPSNNRPPPPRYDQPSQPYYPPPSQPAYPPPAQPYYPAPAQPYYPPTSPDTTIPDSSFVITDDGGSDGVVQEPAYIPSSGDDTTIPDSSFIITDADPSDLAEQQRGCCVYLYEDRTCNGGASGKVERKCRDFAGSAGMDFGSFVVKCSQ